MQLDALEKIPNEHRGPIEFGFETGLMPDKTVALKAVDIDVMNR